MTQETKALLKRSINDFMVATEKQQDEMIQTVRENLKMHENGLKSIGFGYSEDFVTAGKIFLRIFELKEVEI